MSLPAARQSPEGRARSSRNARKHCLTADLVIGPEDREEFNNMLADYQSDVAPQGAIQVTLFDELVAAAWNLRRIRRMETELCARAASYHDLLADDQIQTKLDRLARHKSRIERTFHRSLKELKTLQTTQAIGHLMPQDILEKVPPLASTIEISKRSQPAGSSWPFARSLDPVDLQWTGPADAPDPTIRAHELEQPSIVAQAT
jgi:hypothetical protein